MFLQALALQMCSQSFWCGPFIQLLFRQNPTGCQSIDADVPRAKFTGQRIGQTCDPRVRRCIGCIARIAHHVADRGKIYDCPASADHSLGHRLTGKKIGLEIYRLGPVPKIFAHLSYHMALIIGGIIDQDLNGTMDLGSLINRTLQSTDICDVTGNKERCLTIFFNHLRAEGRCIRPLDKGHRGPLRQKPFAQRRANA